MVDEEEVDEGNVEADGAEEPDEEPPNPPNICGRERTKAWAVATIPAFDDDFFPLEGAETVACESP